MDGYTGYIVKDEDGSLFFFCSQCGCYWKPRNEKVKPRSCPSCRSTVWMKPYEKKKCLRCGHEWGTTCPDPKRCPACGTYKWDERPQEYSCFRCNYVWNAKREWIPKRCPKCNSTKWQEPFPEKSDNPSADRRDRLTGNLGREATDGILGLYGKGESCTFISISTGIPFSTVFKIVRDADRDKTVRI